MYYKVWSESRFPLQTPRSHAGRFCLCTGGFALLGSCTSHGIDSAEQIHIEETGIALIPGVDEYSFFFSAD